jgi:multiple sugar transport system permease protein
MQPSGQQAPDSSIGETLLATGGVATLVLNPPRRTRFSRSRKEALWGVLFASPWLFGFLVLTLGPMLFSLYASFTEYDIVNWPPKFVGWHNYQFMFQDDAFFAQALRNTFFYVLVKTPVVLLISLLLALLMNQKVPGLGIFRTIFYMPSVLTGVAAVFLFIWLLSPYGLINNGLRLIHLQTPAWFYDPAWSKPGLIIMSMWYVGSPMLIMLAGLSGIPRQLYEAAEIDGAGIFRKFRNITIPMLSPTLFFLMITQLIGAFQVFNSAYIVSTSVSPETNPGAPQGSLLFYEVYLYWRFTKLQMGFACALSWVLFVIVLVITMVQLWLSRKWVYYEAV